MTKDISHSRRNFLKNSCIMSAGAGLLTAAPSTFAKAATSKEKILSFYHIHTGERIAAPFWENGKYLNDAIAEISYVLRDHRSGKTMPMDRELLDYLYKLKQLAGPNYRFEVVSAFRSPKSNRFLKGRDKTGVAKKSYHMKGQAIDVRLPGVELSKLHRAARSLKLGGLGYYPKNNFIHLDTGRVRSWKG